VVAGKRTGALATLLKALCRAATLARRAHLPPFLPAGRRSARRTLGHQAQWTSFHGKGLRADPNTASKRPRFLPSAASSCMATSAAAACSSPVSGRIGLTRSILYAQAVGISLQGLNCVQVHKLASTLRPSRCDGDPRSCCVRLLRSRIIIASLRRQISQGIRTSATKRRRNSRFPIKLLGFLLRNKEAAASAAAFPIWSPLLHCRCPAQHELTRPAEAPCERCPDNAEFPNLVLACKNSSPGPCRSRAR
jgi:hypothetical protein